MSDSHTLKLEVLCNLEAGVCTVNCIEALIRFHEAGSHEGERIVKIGGQSHS